MDGWWTGVVIRVVEGRGAKRFVVFFENVPVDIKFDRSELRLHPRVDGKCVGPQKPRSAMSYWLCKAPAVGASGAIFGLVGSYAMFVLRHRNLNNDGMGDLQHIANVIILNMGIGLMSKGIDNWGHLGGLIGGVATSWLIGPAWKYESPSNDRRRAFVDKAPIFSLIKTKRRP